MDADYVRRSRTDVVANRRSRALSAKSPPSPTARLWPLLLIVNGGWIAFLVAAHTVLPGAVGDADGWPRALVRVGILLIPSLVYLGKFDQGTWAARMGLVANCRRGLFVGVTVSLLWFIPQFIARWKSGQPSFDTDLTAGVWLNAIVGSPFAEELLYRQIVFRTLSERLPFWKAVSGSALWFTLLHLPAGIITNTPMELAQYLFVIFAYGVIFAFVYSVTRSLWGPLIPHVANNLFYAVVVGK